MTCALCNDVYVKAVYRCVDYKPVSIFEIIIGQNRVIMEKINNLLIKSRPFDRLRQGRITAMSSRRRRLFERESTGRADPRNRRGPRRTITIISSRSPVGVFGESQRRTNEHRSDVSFERDPINRRQRRPGLASLFVLRILSNGSERPRHGTDSHAKVRERSPQKALLMV